MRTWIIVGIGVILVLIAATSLQYAKMLEEGRGEPTQPPRKAPAFTEAEIDLSRYRILLEAESPAQIEAPAHVVEKDGASAGKCVFIGPEKVNEKKETAQYTKGHPQAKHPGYARYTITPKTTGSYQLYVRAFWSDACGDSISISFNDVEPQMLAGSTHGRWSWNLLRDATGRAVPLHLNAGEPLTLTICNREDDVYVDQILLRHLVREWPVPTGIAD